MKVALQSDIGRKRVENEDRIYVDERLGVFIVADGMGGHKAGKVASSLAVEYAHSYILNNIDQVEKDINGFSTLLQSAFEVTHNRIKELSTSDNNLMGMGTTLLIVILINRKGLIAHVGDSRAYIVNETITQLTTDHTIGEYLVANKKIKPDKISTLSWHRLTQAVGESEEIIPEVTEVKIRQGEILLLCSDGLTDMLKDIEIKDKIMENSNNLNRMATELVDAANQKGGKDNISLILIGNI